MLIKTNYVDRQRSIRLAKRQRPIPSQDQSGFFCPIGSPSLVANDLTLTNTKCGEGMFIQCPFEVVPLLEELFSHPRLSLRSPRFHKYKHTNTPKWIFFPIASPSQKLNCAFIRLGAKGKQNGNMGPSGSHRQYRLQNHRQIIIIFIITQLTCLPTMDVPAVLLLLSWSLYVVLVLLSSSS